MEICYQPIGVLQTPFEDLADMPVQPAAANGVTGKIKLDDNLAAGLKDLSGFSHLIVLYHFHQAGDVRLTVTPFLDTRPHGVFATRAPTRPNPIGLSVLRLCRVDRTTIEVEGVDMLNGSPVLDIKPYVPAFDAPNDGVVTGWLEHSVAELDDARSDSRFVDQVKE